jgi:hypothetical protein
MAALPPALDFAKTEEEICAKWAEEQTFKKQDELSLERGDEVRLSLGLLCVLVVLNGGAVLLRRCACMQYNISLCWLSLVMAMCLLT